MSAAARSERSMMKFESRLGVAAILWALATGATAQTASQEAAIRKNLAERVPQLAKIDEVSKTPIPGLFEVRVGIDVLYTDAEGNYLLQGSLLDVKNKRNLTEERVEKLSAVDFDALPFKDAFTVVRGSGKRKMAVFQDPNCGYCKMFERDLQKVDNVTIHMFLLPVLGNDSKLKARNIWCARDKAKAWQDWMVRDQTPAAATCDAAVLDRNVEFSKKHNIRGTPTLLFADGSRVPGVISAAQVEKFLSEAK